MRQQGNESRLGNASEALALAAFQMDGIPVALPFGCPERWDLVAKLDGRWQAVQVKTAHHGQTSGFLWNARTTKDSTSYTSDEIDLFVIVYPETGRMWKILIADADGKSSVPLTDEYLWKPGNITECAAPHPDPAITIPYRPHKIRKSYLRVLLEGHDLSGPCPESCRSPWWEAARLHVAGVGLWRMAREFKRDASTIEEWIERVLYNTGWAQLSDLKRLVVFDDNGKAHWRSAKSWKRRNAPVEEISERPTEQERASVENQQESLYPAGYTRGAA